MRLLLKTLTVLAVLSLLAGACSTSGTDSNPPASVTSAVTTTLAPVTTSAPGTVPATTSTMTPVTQPSDVTQPPEVVTPVPTLPILTLTAVPDTDPIRVSTVIGEFEFTTMEVPPGHSMYWSASTPQGTVAVNAEVSIGVSTEDQSWDVDRLTSLRWSTDHESWEGIAIPSGVRRVTAVGDDVVVHDPGVRSATRYGWDGDGWSEVAQLDVGQVEQIISGPAGVVAITGTSIQYSGDGVHFTEAAAAPATEPLSAEGPDAGSGDEFAGGCQPSSSAWFSEATIGAVAATPGGFVALTPTHPSDWNRAPICAPLVWSSADGRVWELVSSESPFGDGAFVFNVAERDGRLVAAGGVTENEGAIWLSDDGVGWERADIDLGLAEAVVAGDLGWVVLGMVDVEGNERGIWFSDSGLVWDGPYEPPGGLTNVWVPPLVTVGSEAIFGPGAESEMVVGRLRQ